ncbi:hypothetical protein KKC1_29240 [Calderihabitans maritimus]|uniref:Uncharacterized protein n=1 Tax=Calderihabitans maritimus TaxID=1246530 RepID=A0A1Z5HWQ9_9FIRM|nr:hypothetical protein KKC1_29240 [Calderihabitans maritimus]
MEELAKLGLDENSRKVQKLASNIEFRRLVLLTLGEILQELKELNAQLKDQEYKTEK